MWYHYILWVPIVFVYYSFYYWMSLKVNKNEFNLEWHQDKWFWIMYFMGILCPFWSIVSRISTRLFIDGILYDQIMLVSYYVTMIYLGQGVKFGWWQWVGVCFLFVGCVLVRISKPT